MTYEETEQMREWRPGDGLRCRFSSIAAVPCGPPVRTKVSIVSMVGRAPQNMRHVLCANHAANSIRGYKSSGTLTMEARKRATERLITEHWDEFNKLFEDAIATVRDEIMTTENDQ